MTPRQRALLLARLNWERLWNRVHFGLVVVAMFVFLRRHGLALSDGRIIRGQHRMVGPDIDDGRLRRVRRASAAVV